MFDLIPWRRKDVQTAPGRSPADLRREMDSMFQRFFDDAGWTGMVPHQRFAPALDVSETDDEFIIKADLPGMDPKDVQITLTGNVLTIHGEKKDEKEDKQDNYHRFERSYGSFSRSLQLPCEVDEGKVQAKSKNGVLDLRLPKAENAKGRTVKIQVE